MKGETQLRFKKLISIVVITTLAFNLLPTNHALATTTNTKLKEATKTATELQIQGILSETGNLNKQVSKIDGGCDVC